MTEKCNSCDQMKKENSLMRKSLTDANRMYVEVVNENLKLVKKLNEEGIYYHGVLAETVGEKPDA